MPFSPLFSISSRHVTDHGQSQTLHAVVTEGVVWRLQRPRQAELPHRRLHDVRLSCGRHVRVLLNQHVNNEKRGSIAS